MEPAEPNPQESRLAGYWRRLTARPPVLGLLVADASMKLLFANNEATTILTYPGRSSQSLADVFDKKVRPSLFSAQGSLIHQNGVHLLLKLKSGRRTYFCRAFPLDSNGKSRSGHATLLVLAREMPGPVELSRVSQQFHLTHRQQQAVALLLRGLSNKEIAKNMGISANTVKAFLHLATAKMGVSRRSGIVTKILGLLLSSTNAELSNQEDIG